MLLSRESKTLLQLWKENSLGAGFAFRLKKALRSTKSQQLVIHGQKITLRPTYSDLTVAHETLGSEFKPLGYLFDPNHNGLILDAGGYIGTAALALSNLYPRATVVTLEPSTSNFALLQKNTAGRGNIHAIQAALVPEDGPAEIVLADRGTGHWGYTIVADKVANGGEVVKTITLDKLLKQFDSTHFMIAKLDIEGAESSLFAQGSDWLDQIDALFIELHERIVAGTEAQFMNANTNRIIVASGGEKYLSLRQTLRNPRG